MCHWLILGPFRRECWEVSDMLRFCCHMLNFVLCVWVLPVMEKVDVGDQSVKVC